MARVGDGIEIVDEAASTAKESLILQAGHRPTDPRPRFDRDTHPVLLPRSDNPCMSDLRSDLTELLEEVRRGHVAPDQAVERFAELPFRDLGFARVDSHRELRQGAPEAVLAEGKTPEQVAEIAAALLEAGAGSVLVTRADEAARAAVRSVAPDAEEHARARAVWVARGVPAVRGCVTLVSAGTSDGPVLHEARIRAELIGTETLVHEDVGVAGIHRLADALPSLVRADCVVVVAGMDGALASVVGGLAAAPVIGVPTSVGYGAAEGGRTALNAMLCSCAAGLAVVGIDDGFGAGTIAARIARAAGTGA
jgi:pyridinium-3,5-biscarboxylic acid mononucleotide synthase